MQDDIDPSGQNDDVQQSDGEASSEQSGISRRTVLKGMYAAPAIMAVGSLPSFASGKSPAGGGGHHDHDKWDDWEDKWDDDQDKEKDWKDGWWGWHWWWW